MNQPTTLDQIKNMATTAIARKAARQAVVEGRMKTAKIKHLLNKPRPRLPQPQA